MASTSDKTEVLLRQWHGGNRGALEQLLERDLGWVEQQVRKRLGGELRGKVETQDLVQEAMVDVLQYGPKFVMSDLNAFRKLMARIIENNIRDGLGWMKARRRAGEREIPLAPDDVLDLDMPRKKVTSVTEAVFRRQRSDLVRVAMELLDPEDRMLIYGRQWEKKPYEEIGAKLGIKANAARMRYQRALQKLARQIQALESGRLDPPGGED